MTDPMNEEAQESPLTRKIRVVDIQDDVPQVIETSREEREAIKDLLELEALDELRCDYTLRQAGRGRYRLKGRLKANLAQTCVVSLEPVPSAIDIPLEMEFWPEAMVADLERKAEDPGQAGLIDWPETIVDGAIDLGPVVYETFATVLEPYPRKEGVSFEWSQGEGEPDVPKNKPFAALERLKKR